MDNKIWSYFIYLSNHMWDDENTPPRALYEPQRYQENNNVDVQVWDDIMNFLQEKKFNMVVVDLGDGVRYESHPEICAPDAWDKDFLKKKLDEMRAKGLEPIPKLNFSLNHSAWMKEYRRMGSTSYYYQFCSDIIREVCELFDSPRLFHLGLDEEKVGTATMKYREAIRVRGEALWWHDAYFIFKEAEKNGARPWMWADYFWDHPDVFAEKMPRSVLQSNWFYESFRESYSPGSNRPIMMGAYEKLDALGFEQVPCCSACEGVASCSDTIYQTLMHGKSKLQDDLVKGYLVVPWERTEDFARYYLMDNAHRFHLARQKVYPESLK